MPHIQKDLKPGSNMIGKSVVFEGKLMAFDKYVAYNEFIWDCQQRRGGCQRQTCTLTADSYKKGCQHCGLKNTLIINYQETKVHLKYKLYFEGGLVGDCSASRNLTINTNYRLFGVVQVPGNIVSGLVQVPDSYQSGSKRADFVDLFIEGYSLQALTIQEELASNSRVQVKENLFERLVCGFCPGLTGKDLLKAFLLLVALARRPFKVLLIGDPSTGKSLIGEELVKLSQYTGFPCKLLNDIQSTCKLPFQLLCTLAKYSNEFLICTATPLQGHFK